MHSNIYGEMTATHESFADSTQYVEIDHRFRFELRPPFI